MKIGSTTISDLKVGSAAVQKVYLGSQVVWMPAAGEFDPLSLTPSLWLDADDATTITATSGEVTAWADKSASVLSANQSESGRYPKTGTRTVNGKNAVDFDGTDDWLFTASARIADGTDGTCTTFCVFLPDVVTGEQQILSQDKSGGLRVNQWNRINGTDCETVRIGGDVFSDASGTTVSSGSVSIGVSRYQASSIEAIHNGSTNGSTATTGTHETALVEIGIGASPRSAGSAPFNGLIAEILAYPYDMTNAQINDVSNYLADKWAGTWTNL